MLSCRQGTCITSDNPVSTSNELQSPVNYPESYDGLGKRVRKLSNKYDGFDEPIAVYSLLLSLFIHRRFIRRYERHVNFLAGHKCHVSGWL